MNQEQKFDKIIRKKVDEAQFPFDEQNWNKLSMQLDAERKISSKRGWGKFLFLGLLFLGITSVGIALYKTQSPLGVKEKLANKMEYIDNSNSSVNAQNTIGNFDKHSDNNLLALNTENSKSSNSANYTTSNLNEVNNSSEGAGSANVNAAATSEINNSKKAILITNVANEFSGKNNSVSVQNKKSSNYSSILKQKENNGLTKTGIENSEENSSKTGDANEMNSSSRTKSDLSGSVNLDHTVLDRLDARLPIINSNRNVKLGIVKVPSWYDEDYHRKGKKRLSFLNAEIGAAYLLGWNSKAGKDGRGFNWYAGVNYGKFLNKKMGFSVGSQFYNVGNINQSFYECSKSVYGLGSTSSNTVITTQSLFYFSVPVKIYYALNASNQIGASVNPSFLFSSKNKVENYRLTDGIRSNEIKSNTSGIYEGVRLNNVLVSVFYKTKLSKRANLNAEFLYGVRDIFKNTNSNNYTQKPIGVRLGLQFTLFEK
jgi:hypothetical protein